jgi:SAM-dependent methyltransferase
MLESLRRRGATGICGVEPSQVAAQFASTHVVGSKIYVSDWEHASLEDERFDVVCGLDLIEHLYDPRAFVRWAKARLVSGGVLYLKTPNWGAVKKYGAAWGGLSIDFEHVCYFSAETLPRLLLEEGFNTQFIGYETARVGLAGENLLGQGGERRLVASARRVVRSLPGVNKVAYGGLEAARRRRCRADLDVGVADVLVTLATG